MDSSPATRLCRAMMLFSTLHGIKLRSSPPAQFHLLPTPQPYSRDPSTMADKENTLSPTAAAIAGSTTSPVARRVQTSSPPPEDDAASTRAETPAAPTITVPEDDDYLEAVCFFLLHCLFISNQCHRKTSLILALIVPLSDRMPTSLYNQDNVN